MDIGSIEPGNIIIRILTTNSVYSTLLNDEKFEGKVIQPLYNGSKLLSEHGIAISIEISEVDKKRVFLLDTGGPKRSIIENSAALGFNLGEIEKLILSHSHPDHFGSLFALMEKLKAGTEIIINPEIYDQNVIFVPKSGNFYSPQELSENLGDLKKQKAFGYDLKLPILNKNIFNNLLEKYNLNLIEIKEPMKLTNGLIVSGSIKILDPSEISKGFYLMQSRKEFKENTFRDENALYFSIKDKGLVVITGCGHCGIINIIKYGQQLTGIERIYAIIGGFHKEWDTPESIQKTVDFIEALNPEITCGVHCTGFEFQKQMSKHPSYIIAGSGTEFHL